MSLTTKQDQALAAIASEWLFLKTLERTNSGADFSEQSVWCIKSALEAAFAAGQASNSK